MGQHTVPLTLCQGAVKQALAYHVPLNSLTGAVERMQHGWTWLLPGSVAPAQAEPGNWMAIGQITLQTLR